MKLKWKRPFLLPVWKQQTMLTFQIYYEHATHFEAILAEANKKADWNLLLNLKMAKPALVYNSSQKTILL
jgi:hypothetical protein